MRSDPSSWPEFTRLVAVDADNDERIVVVRKEPGQMVPGICGVGFAESAARAYFLESGHPLFSVDEVEFTVVGTNHVLRKK